MDGLFEVIYRNIVEGLLMGAWVNQRQLRRGRASPLWVRTCKSWIPVAFQEGLEAAPQI